MVTLKIAELVINCIGPLFRLKLVSIKKPTSCMFSIFTDTVEFVKAPPIGPVSTNDERRGFQLDILHSLGNIVIFVSYY